MPCKRPCLALFIVRGNKEFPAGLFYNQGECQDAAERLMHTAQKAARLFRIRDASRDGLLVNEFTLPKKQVV